MTLGERQLSLRVSLDDSATFDNFYTSDHHPNLQALAAIRQLLEPADGERFIFLWGSSGCGLSHLLQAACHRASALQLSSQYLPLSELAGFDAHALLDGLEHLDLICLDGVQHVMGQQDWDRALFNLYNRLREQGHCRLLVTANCAPRDLDDSLPDLVSRLGWGTTYRLLPLTDAEKIQALAQRALARGLEIQEDALQFLAARISRDTHQLFALLDYLDEHSLAHQRKLTIPFIKQALGL